MKSRHARILAVALFAAAALPALASAKELFVTKFDGVYTSRAMVTGTRPETRPAGFADCLEDVLVKVSGDPKLIGDPRLDKWKPKAGAMVVHYSYHDQLEGIPIHDEQGTRDRAFDLVCDFKRADIDSILHELGDKPWLHPRPKLALFVGVKTAMGPFVLASDGERGIDQRISLYTAANKRGLRAVLPNSATVAKLGLDFDKVEAPRHTGLEMMARAAGGNLPLLGTLVWADDPAGWKTHWRFEWRGRTYDWNAQGISFDEAFRRGILGVAQIISGHGAPG